MMSIILSLVTPFFVLAMLSFLIYRLSMFSSREIEGRYWFVSGGTLAMLASTWQAVKIISDYDQWFVPAAYPTIDLVQFLIGMLGVLFLVISISLYADYWQSRRDELEVRQGKLSILENLQHDARQPYHLLEMLNIALREILVNLPGAAGGIMLVNRSRRRFVLTSSSGLSKEETALLEYYPIGRNVLSQSLELGDPLLASQFSFIDNSGKQKGSRFNSCLILPMISGMEKVGLLVLLAEEKEMFGRADIRYLDPVSQWLGEKIKSARLARELAQTGQKLKQHEDDFDQIVSRFAAASKAMSSSEAINSFCRSLTGLASAASAHLCGLKQGRLIMHGGSEPLFDISENYRTALIDALEGSKPLIINQEDNSEEGHATVMLSSLVYPLGSDDSRNALLFRREDLPFEVGEMDLKQMDALSGLASLVLRFDEHQHLALARRQGFEAVLRLLQGDQRSGTFAENPGFFLEHMDGVLPSGSIGLALLRDERAVCRLAKAVGVTQSLDQGSLEILPGEGGIGKAAASREPQFVFGRNQIVKHLESYDDANRSRLQRIFGERGYPVFVACVPVMTGGEVNGVVVICIYDLDESARSEWERLLTLATGLYSLRLTMDDREISNSTTVGAGDDHTLSGSVINRMNNHLSAVLGTAELAAARGDLSGEVRAQFEQIMKETQQAASSLKGASPPRTAGHTPAGTDSDDLNEVIKSVLDGNHVSGDLYMAGQRPREIRCQFGPVQPVQFATTRMRELFEAVLDRFSSTADDEDVMSIATYVEDDYVVLDISRHRHNFPAVEKVAGFGRYDLCGKALENRPTDVYLSYLSDSDCYYAVDRSSITPAYLSFKFPIYQNRNRFSNNTSGAKIRLLAIDDQAVILDLISAMGQSIGYHVTTALTGEDGLSKINLEQFDIVLTDLALPGMSGLEVARQVRQIYPLIPIILVTGWEAGLDQTQLAAAGISKVLYKPFRIEQLTEIVQSSVSSPFQA